MGDKNQEAAVILETGQQVTLAGQQFTMRRLTTRDVFAFSKLMVKALKAVGNREVMSQEELGMILLAGLAEEDREIAGFYSSLIGIKADEFMAQPPEFFSDFLEELPKQYDLAVFFGAVSKAVKSLGSLWQTQ